MSANRVLLSPIGLGLGTLFVATLLSGACAGPDETEPGAAAGEPQAEPAPALEVPATPAATGQPAPPDAAEWEKTKAWVRTDFPGVPACSVPDLVAQLAGRGPRPVLIDARGRNEFAVSHLEGARCAPDLDAALATLEALPRDTPVVVYCSVGYRSARMTRDLIREGFTAVRNLEGSIFEWANAGHPVFREDGETDEVHPYDEEWGRLLRRDLWSEY